MDNLTNIATYVREAYLLVTGKDLTGQRLADFLYLAQRERIAICNRPLYREPITAGLHGPAFPGIDGKDGDPNVLEEGTRYTLKNTILSYKDLSDSELEGVMVEQESWQNAQVRPGKQYDLEDIRKDAQKIRPYDHFCDMYYDEDSENLPEELREEPQP